MNSTPRKIGILGAGGLGRNAVSVLAKKTEFLPVALVDSKGVAYRAEGIRPADIEGLPIGETVAMLAEIGRETSDPVGEILKLNKAGALEAVFIGIPNLPNDNLPRVIERLCDGGFRGVAVDALKRTTAVEAVVALAPKIEASGMVYVTGAGATPGLLTAAANLAAQSFSEVESVDIRFGVGIPSWESYKATVREDIAHMPGYNVEAVRAMTDADVESLLDELDGILRLEGMEHADDILLERAGVVQAAKVTVGGIVDTRRARKPISTHMTLTGVTFEGKRSSHTFTLGDDTSMAANVLGPAFGWMKAGMELRARGIKGLFSSADLMPKFVR
ncbi:MAG: saccharopine dehydrogenase-like oxidoreductase [Candidatus Sumerlaeia bacterium]|nr:saccharopine dehydrogenase-like oxidoreductase [Candidatus Sumerlaeia bacterium]